MRCFLLFLLPVCLVAQYPGQYPTGQQGRIPPSIPGIPKLGKKKQPAAQQDETELDSQEGILQDIDLKKLEVELDDHRTVSFALTEKTKYRRDDKLIQAEDLRPGDRITVVYSTDEKDGTFSAVSVRFVKGGTTVQAREERKPDADPKASEPAVQRELPKDMTPIATPNMTTVAKTGGRAGDDDDGPPTLRRGKPKPKISKEPVAEVAAATPEKPAEAPRPAEEVERPAPPPPSPIELAREAAFDFSKTLPNYVCTEFMARFQSDSKPANFRPIDVVSTEVIYEDGKERYDKITINGKPFKKPITEMSGGAWSTGEFGTILRDLFSPATAAEFRYRREARASNRSAKVFDFQVERENSHWKIMTANQSVLPAYKGTIWVDKETNRVLRIEMQARDIPKAFPLDAVESSVDYEFIRLGTGDQFLLPVHSETLSCERGSYNCSLNKIDFRNYHKFTGESTILFTEQKEEKPKDEKKK